MVDPCFTCNILFLGCLPLLPICVAKRPAWFRIGTYLADKHDSWGVIFRCGLSQKRLCWQILDDTASVFALAADILACNVLRHVYWICKKSSISLKNFTAVFINLIFKRLLQNLIVLCICKGRLFHTKFEEARRYQNWKRTCFTPF